MSLLLKWLCVSCIVARIGLLSFLILFITIITVAFIYCAKVLDRPQYISNENSLSSLSFVVVVIITHLFHQSLASIPPCFSIGTMSYSMLGHKEINHVYLAPFLICWLLLICQWNSLLPGKYQSRTYSYSRLEPMT